MTADTIPFTFRLDAQLKRELDARAAADFRSTASLLNSIIARHLAGPQQVVPLWSQQLGRELEAAPEPAPEVYYTRPKGRPRARRDMAPMMPAFRQWLEQQPDQTTIRPVDIVTGMAWHKDVTESVKLASARNMLAQADFEPLIAHHPDGSEEEIWRISAINSVTNVTK